MSGFVATDELISSDSPENTVRNSGFFPDIDLAALRETVRLDGTVSHPRLYHAAVEAISSANRDLRDWRVTQQAAGYSTLDAVPAETIDGKSELVYYYLRAVYSTASANLRERYRDSDTTADGHKAADSLETPIDDLRRDARWAIHDLLGIPRSTIELI